MKVFLLVVCYVVAFCCGAASAELWRADFHYAAVAIWPVGIIATGLVEVVSRIVPKWE